MIISKYNLIQIFTRFTLVVIITAIAVLCSAQFAGGEGTEEDPWQIETTTHLNNVRNYTGDQHDDKYFIQTADIDLGVFPWNVGQGWTPIGNWNDSFQGSYDGAGFIIENLTINRPSENDQALFGLTEGAIVKNLGLIDIDIVGYTRIAGLIGNLREGTLVLSCFVTGNIQADDMWGGMVGGIAGEMRDEASLIINCYSTVHITMITHDVGIIRDPFAAGIVGLHYDGVVSRSYAIGRVKHSGESDRVAALIGATGEEDVLSFLYWDSDTVGQTDGIGRSELFPGNNTLEMLEEETYNGFDFNNDWDIVEEFSYPWLEWESGPGQHNIPSPRDLEAEAYDEEISLSWLPPVMTTQTLGYNIYRDGEMINEQLITFTEYDDTDADNWRFYDYTVTAMYEAGESSHTQPVRISAVSFADGDGTLNNPYTVETAEHLNGVRYSSTSYFTQIDDIDLNQEPWNEGEGWLPIGSADLPFEGYYDGDYYSISNLIINRDDDNQGLFGYVDGAVLKKINIDNAIISSVSSIGGVVGLMEDSDVESCSVTGLILGEANVGGIVGLSRGNSTIRQCYTTGFVRSSSTISTAAVGGLVGFQTDNSSVIDSYTTSSVTGFQRRVGGLVGVNWNGGEIIRSYATGFVTVNYPDINYGGLVGEHFQAGEIVNSYWNIESTGQEESAGGTGLTTNQMLTNENFNNWNFTNVWNQEQDLSYPYLRWQDDTFGHNIPAPGNLITETDYNEGSIFLSWQNNNDPEYYHIYRNGEIVGSVDYPLTQWTDNNTATYIEYIYSVTAVYELDDELLETSFSNFVSVIMVEPFEGGDGSEENPFQVASAHQLCNIRYLLNNHYIQVNDIDLNTEPWNDGEGWGKIGSNQIGQRFNGTYDGDEYVISNLYINKETNYQGLFAYAENAIIKNVSLDDVDITGNAYVGSIVGLLNNSDIRNCSVSGVVTGTGAYVGGIVGDVIEGEGISNAIIGCKSAVDISGGNYTGGLIGHFRSGEVVYCWASGDVTGNNYTGGLVGWSRDEITNSYAVNHVQGGSHVGGLVGRNSGIITNSYSAGLVAGEESVGGLIGSTIGLAHESYWDIETSNQENSAGGSGRLTRQMTYPYDQQTYIDWDFEDIWMNDIHGFFNDRYPLLRYHIELLDSPQPTIEIVEKEGIKYAHIEWDAIEDANSYLIFATDDPGAGNWGEPLDIFEETKYTEPVNQENKLFYIIIASSQELRNVANYIRIRRRFGNVRD